MLEYASRSTLLTLRKRVLRISSFLLGAILMALVVLECIQVVLRYLFGIGIFWAMDVTTLLLLSFGWLGAAHLWATHSHLAVDLLGRRIRLSQTLILAVSDLLVIVGVIWMLPQISLTMEIYSGMTMPALDLSLASKFIPPSIGLCLIGLSALINLGDYLGRYLLPRKSS